MSTPQLDRVRADDSPSKELLIKMYSLLINQLYQMPMDHQLPTQQFVLLPFSKHRNSEQIMLQFMEAE